MPEQLIIIGNIFCHVNIFRDKSEKEIHKYFPSRRAMSERSIDHEKKRKILQHKCFHNK